MQCSKTSSKKRRRVNKRKRRHNSAFHAIFYRLKQVPWGPLIAGGKVIGIIIVWILHNHHVDL
jgi:hypothetical protein